MEWSFLFFVNSVLLGVGLAMDAFSVSLANGLHEPGMRWARMGEIAGVFAVFQAVMPMVGWVCVHTVVKSFRAVERLVPWIALILLLFIGGKMIADGVRDDGGDAPSGVGFAFLMIQGVATSIDALSVGFTIAGYDFIMALVCAGLIACVTFILCLAGLILGKKFGTVFAGKASVLGGIILMLIGIEIFVNGIL